jgi:predicted dehydrogenase
MAAPVRIALIGAGAFGVGLLETLQQIRDVELLMIADADVARAKNIASRFAIRHATSSALEAIRTDGVNTVVIATPETMHVEPVLAALDAGKDVFVEKPLAHDSASARKLVKAWKDSGRILMPGHIVRFEARVQATRARLANSGAVRSICGFQHRARATFEKYKRVHPALVIMIHQIDLSLAFAQSKVVKIDARERFFLEPDSPSNVWAWLEFENGAIASLQMGYDLECASPAAPDDAMEIVTEKERIRIAFHDEGYEIADKNGCSTVDLCYTQALRAELEYFIGCVQTRRQPTIVTPEDGLAAVEIAERIIAAAKAK